nr:DUF4185 domain-containing protein [Mycobacterium sp. URHB0044]
MGAASYVGRVGRLAVALGVGTAIATSHGVAVADDAPPANSSTESVQSTGTAPTADAQPEPTAPTASEPTEPGATTTSTTTSTKTTTSNTTTSTLPSGVVVSAQTTTGTTGATSTAETADPAPTETATPEPTATPKPTPTNDAKPSPEPKPQRSTSTPNRPTDEPSTPPATATTQARAAATTASRPADTVAAHTVSALSLATASAVNRTVDSPAVTVTAPTHAPANPLQTVADVVTGVVSSVIGWALGPLAGAAPTTPAQPPLAWTMLAFVRREFDDLVASLGGSPASNVALAATQTTTSLALAAAPLALSAINVPAFPTPGAQLSPSTQFVQWVTGDYQTGNPLIADTLTRFGIAGTDVGVMWDNGMQDDPSTPYNEHQILMAFGDTFSGDNMTGAWRFNVLLRSADTVLSDGMTIPNGEWFNGNMFGGTPLGNPTFARQIIHPDGLPAGITLIPTAGISLPTPGTRFGVTQYVNFMSVTNWGAPGSWTTNYSAIAYSVDNGENWTVAPTSVRYNQPWTGNQNFQQGAFVRPGDGYVYNYGTPNGRQGAAYVSRVLEKDILDVSKYEYYSKGTTGGWFGWGATAAGWHKNNPAAATPVFGQDQGACGVANPGNQVSEMSVQFNKQLNKYVVLYGDQFNNIVMRTSDSPQGKWSTAKVLLPQQPGGIYAPMMHPWSSSTMGTGNDLYWNLSLWSEYNVMLMKTDLTKV